MDRKTHKMIVQWQGMTYTRLRLGKHGAARLSGEATIRLSDARAMFEHFGILRCAAETVAGLRKFLDAIDAAHQ
jgi:hypothetical protein